MTIIERREKRWEIYRRHYLANRHSIIARNRIWQLQNPVEDLKERNALKLNELTTISDKYLKQLLRKNFPLLKISQEMVLLKRKSLAIKRLNNVLKNLILKWSHKSAKHSRLCLKLTT